MKTYRIGNITDPELRREFQSIQKAAFRADPTTELEMRSSPPANPVAGSTLAMADGVNWNPGSGEGLYRYSSTGTWVFIG